MSTRDKITIRTLAGWKRNTPDRKIAMLTCYDYSTACLMEEAGVDSLLVGDTYSEVCLGNESTLPVELDHLVTLCTAVRKGAPTAFLVGDMPFLSYQVSVPEAVRNAGQFLAKAGCDCVKIEMDRRLVSTLEAMSTAGIPVMAHLGLRPQAIHQIGGYVSQGKQAKDAMRLIEDAKIVEEAGAVALLLEAVPMEVAGAITSATSLPVIGCVSGPLCDGQVVVMHDMLGYSAGHPPRSVKRYANMHDILVEAFQSYTKDVVHGEFPTREHSISMKAIELEEMQRRLDQP